MKKMVGFLMLLILAILCYQLYSLYSVNRELKEVFSSLGDKIDFFKKEGEKLQADLGYLSEPENIEKELRARFNLKKPGEKLIIVVPPKETNNQ